MARDWELYAPLLAPSGLVIFDNYRDGTCPGVDRFVDQLLDSNRTVQAVTHLGRSVVLRRVRT